MKHGNATIRRVLDLSTAHLPQPLLLFGSRDGTPGVWGNAIVYVLDYGFLLWVPDDPTDESNSYDVPREIVEVQLYAREAHCDYVLFDADGPKNPDLETFDDELPPLEAPAEGSLCPVCGSTVALIDFCAVCNERRLSGERRNVDSD